MHFRDIHVVKALWRNHLIKEATWEANSDMRSSYPSSLLIQ